MGGALKDAGRLSERIAPKLGISLEQLAELRPEPVELRGRSIVLRSLSQDDAEALGALVEKNLDALLDTGVVTERDSHRDLYARVVTAEACDLGYDFTLTRDDQVIGQARLAGVVRGNRQSATLSLWIDEEHRGEGHAEEAFVLLVGHAIEGLQLHRVEVVALPDNDAVTRALDKVGVTSVGVDPACLMVRGEWRDHERYVFTAEDWAERGDALRGEFT